MFAAALLAVAAGTAFAQGIDGLIGPPMDAKKVKPVVQPMAAALGSESRAVPAVTLAAFDATGLEAEDRARALTGDKTLRVATARDVAVRVASGRWDPIPGKGWLWRIDLVSTRASAVRVHVTGANLAEGAQLLVYTPETTAQIFGPFTGRGPAADGEFWSPPIVGERLRVEYFVPGDVTGKAPNETPFGIDQLLHYYRDPTSDSGARSPGENAPLEGNCHNDVTCFPAWASLTHAVARIDYVSGGNGFQCTGQLMNDLNGDLTPYFLTANHCISAASEANSAVLYWDYQTSVCNGAVPPLGSVPTSSFCTLLSNNAASDYSLLMVEGTLPGGRFWSGWESGGQADGQAMAGIHHPDGAYKRISFGNKSSVTNCGGANHIRSNWTSGVTEGGSSGSGLYRTDNQRLTGQLHCGPSFCGAPAASLNDDYGAFSVTYPNISALLNGGSDDGLENNDACAAAVALAAGTYNNLVVKSTDEDWYSFAVGANRRITITLNFTHAWGDIDMVLYNACGGSVVGSSTGVGNTETIDYYNTGGATNFKLWVHLFSDTRNYYNMTVTINPFPNLNAGVTPGGFSYPAVPRNAGGAALFNCPITPTLDGNVADTYMNWAIQNEGPGDTPEGWQSRLYIDQDFSGAFGFFDIGPNNPGSFSWQALNVGPFTIRGGRHTFTSYADYNNTMLESNESDNNWTGQWVWSPLALGFQSPLVRAVPPPTVTTPPNADGFSFTRNPTYAWVVGECPLTSGDDFDLAVYDDYSGSTSGFSNFRSGSTFGGQFTDWVVGHFSGTPTTVYPATYRFAAGSGGDFCVDASDARNRNASADFALFPNEVMAPYRLVDVYEAFFVSGTTYYMQLARLSGTSDLAFEVFPGTSGGIYGPFGYEAISGVVNPYVDEVSFSAATTGWHPIVVYRTSNTGANQAVSYHFAWGNTPVAVDGDGGGPAQTFDLAFSGAVPNPTTERASLNFTLATAAPVRLTLFDVNGRRVRMLAEGSFEAGPHAIAWDGRDDGGGRVHAGIYWARMETVGKQFTRRIVMLE